MADLPLRKGVAPRPDSRWPISLRGMYVLFRTTAEGETLSLRALARRADMSPNGVRYIIEGKRKPSLRSGLKLARALGKSPWWILEYSERIRKRPESQKELDRDRRMLEKAFGRKRR